MQSQARKGSGVLTWVGDDGYVITAPVSSFSVAVEDDYSAVQTDYLLDSSFIYKTSQSVVFTAELKYGENYTIKDIGTDVARTLAVKGTVEYRDRSALGVPSHAEVSYDPEKDLTVFTWSDRVILHKEEAYDDDRCYCGCED